MGAFVVAVEVVGNAVEGVPDAVVGVGAGVVLAADSCAAEAS